MDNSFSATIKHLNMWNSFCDDFIYELVHIVYIVVPIITHFIKLNIMNNA